VTANYALIFYNANIILLDKVVAPLKITDCGVKFFSLTKMLKHDRKKHTGVKDYECRLCGAEVTDIHVHMRVRPF